MYKQNRCEKRVLIAKKTIGKLSGSRSSSALYYMLRQAVVVIDFLYVSYMLNNDADYVSDINKDVLLNAEQLGINKATANRLLNHQLERIVIVRAH